MEDRGVAGSRAGTSCGLQEEPAGQSHPGLRREHSHAGCCRSIQLYRSHPALTLGADEHKAPLARDSSARPESLCVASDRDGQRVRALAALGPGQGRAE